MLVTPWARGERGDWRATTAPTIELRVDDTTRGRGAALGWFALVGWVGARLVGGGYVQVAAGADGARRTALVGGLPPVVVGESSCSQSRFDPRVRRSPFERCTMPLLPSSFSEK